MFTNGKTPTYVHGYTKNKLASISNLNFDTYISVRVHDMEGKQDVKAALDESASYANDLLKEYYAENE